MEKYTELTVTYLLDEQQMKKLEELTEMYRRYKSEDGRRPLKGWTAENAFRSIMRTGCAHEIQEKIEFYTRIMAEELQKENEPTGGRR